MPPPAAPVLGLREDFGGPRLLDPEYPNSKIHLYEGTVTIHFHTHGYFSEHVLHAGSSGESILSLIWCTLEGSPKIPGRLEAWDRTVKSHKVRCTGSPYHDVERARLRMKQWDGSAWRDMRPRDCAGTVTFVGGQLPTETKTP